MAAAIQIYLYASRSLQLPHLISFSLNSHLLSFPQSQSQPQSFSISARSRTNKKPIKVFSIASATCTPRSFAEPSFSCFPTAHRRKPAPSPLVLFTPPQPHGRSPPSATGFATTFGQKGQLGLQPAVHPVFLNSFHRRTVNLAALDTGFWLCPPTASHPFSYLPFTTGLIDFVFSIPLINSIQNSPPALNSLCPPLRSVQPFRFGVRAGTKRQPRQRCPANTAQSIRVLFSLSFYLLFLLVSLFAGIFIATPPQ